VRLLFDHDVSSRRTARPLEHQGHDVHLIGHDSAFDGLTDAQVFLLAAEDSRILVTRNGRDFEPLAREWGESGRQHAGLILIWTLRSNQFGAIASAIGEVLERYPRQRQWRDLVVAI
jgi:predicted nuclease of predicted toxin-antitoxin system